MTGGHIATAHVFVLYVVGACGPTLAAFALRLAGTWHHEIGLLSVHGLLFLACMVPLSAA